MEWVFNSYYTLIAATLVLLLGKFLVSKSKTLQNFNIPEPVVGGLVAATILYILHAVYGVSFKFEKPLQDTFVLIFFTSIGLTADFSRLKAGGFPLVWFTIIVSFFIIVQNAVGVGLATLLDIDPLLGLIAGSITLTGGHGTAGAWGPTFEQDYGVIGATGLGMAAATFGLVSGGLIGGPVARFLINRMKRQPIKQTAEQQNTNEQADDIFEHHNKTRLITAESAIETLAMFAACLAFAEFVDSIDKEYLVDLPKFVWSLFAGIVLRNILTTLFKVDMFDRAIDVFGNASLSLFLAIALLNLKLWELAGLAVPVTIILLVQTVVMVLYAIFVTYTLMGRDYDAAVLAAGHCGFGMGATPTAVANMQSITERFGSSHKAFLIVPMVGAFFVDIANAALLTGFVNFLR